MDKLNKFRRVMKEGRVAVGTCLDSYSPAAVEVAGYSGMDFCRIDNEYSWRRDEGMEHMLRAAALSGVTPMVRVEKGAPYLISKIFQSGAQAVLVSDINTYDEALAVVKASKYAPYGNRGMSTYSFAGRWGTTTAQEFADWGDSELMVGIMVENQQVVSQLDEIFAIDGLDYGFFGPADFSMSLGLRAVKKSHPQVQDAIKKACDAANRHGKFIGIGISEPWVDEAEKYIAMGYTFIEIGHELAILRATLSSAAAGVRGIKREAGLATAPVDQPRRL